MRKFFFKSFAAAVAAVVFATHVVFAYTVETNFWAERKKAAPLVLPKKVMRRTVIHIQDIHRNAEAQRSIAQAVQELINRRAVDAVALEGAFGLMDFSWARHYPRQDAIKAVADYLLREKRISGPAYVALVSPVEIPRFIGVDDQQHYDANVKAYLQSVRIVSSLKNKLEEKTRGLTVKKSRTARWDYLTGKLLDFALTKKEWGEYQNSKSQVSNSKLETSDLEPFESFYLEAEARDQAMASNLEKTMTSSHANVAVLVTGGFHSAGIDRRLRTAGFTVISFVPKITKIENARRSASTYLRTFTREKTPLDRLFAGEKIFLADNPTVKPAVGRLLADVTWTAFKESAPTVSCAVDGGVLKEQVNLVKKEIIGLDYHPTEQLMQEIRHQLDSYTDFLEQGMNEPSVVMAWVKRASDKGWDKQIREVFFDYYKHIYAEGVLYSTSKWKELRDHELLPAVLKKIAQQASEKLRPGDPRPLGLMGFWRHFFPSGKLLTPRTIGFLSFMEGFAIIGFKMLILKWLSAQLLLLPLPLGTSMVAVLGNVVAWSAMVSLALFPTLWIFHLVFGVLQPDGKPYWNRWLAYVSSFVAASSFLGTPFLVAFFLVHPTLLGPVASYGLLIVGLILGGAAQVMLNGLLMRRHAPTVNLSIEQAKHLAEKAEDLAHATQPILDFLSYRSVVPIDEKMKVLQTRMNYKRGDGIVWKDDLNRNNLPGTEPDAFIVLGSHDALVPVRAAEIYFRLGEKAPKLIIFAGGKGDRNPRHFPAEAYTYRDLFLSRLHELRFRAQEEKERSSLAGGTWSGLHRILMRAKVLLRDAAFFWQTEMAMKKLIVLEDESTNTGENIKNMEKKLFERFIDPHLNVVRRENPFLEKEQLAEKLKKVQNDLTPSLLPKKPMVVTAGVFGLRATATYVKQSALKLEAVISYAAYRINLLVSIVSGRMSYDELLEIAFECSGQMQRLKNYAQPTRIDGEEQQPFIVPVIISDVVKRDAIKKANDELSALLKEFPVVSPKERLAKASVPNTTKRRVFMAITGLLLVFNGLVLYGASNRLGLGGELIGSMYICVIALFSGLVPATMVTLLLSPLPSSLDTSIKPPSVQEVWVRVLLIGIFAWNLGSFLQSLTPRWYLGITFFIANCLMLLLLYGWSKEYEAHKIKMEPVEATPQGPDQHSQVVLMSPASAGINKIVRGARRVKKQA